MGLSPTETPQGLVLLRLHVSFDGQSSYATPCLSPKACLSREPVSLRNQPLLPLAASYHHTAERPGLCKILVDLPNPHLPQAEEWDDSSKHGSWPGKPRSASSCRREATWSQLSDINSRFSLFGKFYKVHANTELVTTEPWLLGEIQD